MNTSFPEADSDELRLGRLIEKAMDNRRAGLPLNVESLLSDDSMCGEQLAELLPVLELLADLSEVSSRSQDDECDPPQNELEGFNPPTISTVGDYRIIRELGRGGMGIVYQAKQISIGRQVALKILPFAALLNQTQLQRFETEATAAARLQHSGIVQVYSVGCERGIHFISMQLVDGPSLSDVIAELRHENTAIVAQETADTVVAKQVDILTRDEDGGHFRAVARIGKEAAEALHYAHENGVLHRDIKPSNLLLGKSGHVWVADFGLARVEDESQLTRTGDILGTLRYMSPEQAEGERVDARSDVYSLGATLYELATLQPVFEAEDRRDIIKQVLAGNPIPPHQVDERISKPLSYVIAKSMARRLNERYQSAQELANDLQRFLDGEVVKAKPTSPTRRAKAWSRGPRVATAAIVSLLILVLLLPFTHHFFQRVPDDSQTKGQGMNVSKTAKVAAAVAAVALMAGKPPKVSVPNPTDLVVSAATEDSLTLEWTSGGGTTAGFVVAYKEGTTYPKSNLRGATVIEVGDVETYTVLDLLTDQIYSFRVCAVDARGKRSPGVLIQGTPAAYPENYDVSPSAYADTESSGAVTGPQASGKYQEVFPASDFQSLPGNVKMISGYAYRPDGDLTTPLQGRYTSLTVRLSTTSASPGSLSWTYADNVGADVTVVFDGTDIDSSTQNVGPVGGPKLFDMIIPFQTLFEYDPSQGNLLIEVSFTYEGGFSSDWVNAAGTGGQHIGGIIGGNTASWEAGGFVTQFTFIP